jgi:hypothetical protein
VFADRAVLQSGVVEHPDVIRTVVQHLVPDRRRFVRSPVPHQDLGPAAARIRRTPIATLGEHVGMLQRVLDAAHPVIDVGQLAVQLELVQLLRDRLVRRAHRQRPLQHYCVTLVRPGCCATQVVVQLIEIA